MVGKLASILVSLEFGNGVYASRSNLPEIDYWNFCEVVVALERFGDLLVAGYAKASSSNP